MKDNYKHGVERKFPKYLGSIDCVDTESIDYFKELERKNEVLLVESPTRYTTKVYTHKNSKLMKWTTL